MECTCFEPGKRVMLSKILIGIGGGPMNYNAYFEKSWRLFTTHLVALLLSTVVLLVGSVLSLGIMMPVMTAGYMQSLLLAVREDRPPEIRDLFGQMRLFFPLLGLSILLTLVLLIGFTFLVLPGLIVAIAMAYFCMYVLPLMSDEEMGLIDAVQESCRMGLREPVGDHVLAVAVFLVLNSLGSSIVFGVLVTQPYSALFVLCVYEARQKRRVGGAGQQDQGPPSPPPVD